MNITISNGWRGPISGVAEVAALSLRDDGTAVLAMKDDGAGGPPIGTTFTAGEDAWSVTRLINGPRGLLSFICTKEAANG